MTGVEIFLENCYHTNYHHVWQSLHFEPINVGGKKQTFEHV